MVDTASKAAPTTPLPLSPIGTTTGRADLFGTFNPVDAEPNPALVWPQCIPVFNKMRTEESQIVSVMRAVKLPIRRTTWRVDGTGCRDEVTEQIADDLGLPILGQEDRVAPRRNRDRFSWDEHLAHVLLMLDFGHMFFEWQVRVDERGKIRLRKLHPRMPGSISNIQTASDGGLVSITQWGSEKVIPVNRLVAYVHEREGANWTGRSVLRGSFRPYFLKDRAIRQWRSTNDRNGMGVPIATGAEGASTEQAQALQKIVSAFRSGDTAGAALPFGAILRLAGVEGQLPSLESEVRYYDEQIARTVLAHFLNLGTQTGSWALGSTFADFFTMNEQTYAQVIQATASMHIVEDLVDWNWGPDEPAPRIVCDEIGSQQAATATAIKMLLDAGALSNDPSLERYLRNQYSLPPAEEPGSGSAASAAPAVDPSGGTPE